MADQHQPASFYHHHLLVLLLLLLLLPIITTATATAHTTALNNCVLVASERHNGMVPCFTTRDADATLPACLTASSTTSSLSEPNSIVNQFTRQHLQSYLDIGRIRREEMHKYLLRQSTEQRLVKLVLDGACSNNLDVGAHGWLTVSGNLLRPWSSGDFERLSGRVDVVVVKEKYW